MKFLSILNLFVVFSQAFTLNTKNNGAINVRAFARLTMNGAAEPWFPNSATTNLIDPAALK